MKFFYLGLAIPGTLGKNAVLDHSTNPPTIVRLHFELDDMPDAIFTKFTFYIATEKTKQALLEAGFSGIRFDEVEISLAPSFAEEHGDEDLGEFFWMKVEGRAFHDDFGLGEKYPRLVVSQRALDLLEELGIPGADVERVEG